MLNLQQVNQIVTAGLTTLETRVAKGKELGIGNPEVIKTSGAYGSVILCALFTGGVEGRLTWTMEWGTGFQIAEAINGLKVDGFNEQTQQALEGLFHEFLQGVANGFSEAGTVLDIRVLPTLVDTSVLLSEDGNPGAIKIPIVLDAGMVNLYLSLVEGTNLPVLAAATDAEAVSALTVEGEIPAGMEVPAEVAEGEGPPGALPETVAENAISEEGDPAAELAAMELSPEALAAAEQAVAELAATEIPAAEEVPSDGSGEGTPPAQAA